MGIQKGLLFAAIQKVTEVNKPFETIVAKGVPPIEGLNGDLEVHINYKEKIPGELEKVGIRELNAILSVEAGQVIAKINILKVYSYNYVPLGKLVAYNSANLEIERRCMHGWKYTVCIRPHCFCGTCNGNW